MVLCNSPNIFQENMSEIFVGLDTVHVYIYELLHVTKISRTEHITVLEEMFARLQKSGTQELLSFRLPQHTSVVKLWGFIVALMTSEYYSYRVLVLIECTNLFSLDTPVLFPAA